LGEACKFFGTREVDAEAREDDSPADHTAPNDLNPAAPIEIELYHGNIAFVQAPVVLGHYEGDAIVGSEGTMDRLLDGRLGRRRKLGRYPGPLGTVQLVLREGDLDGRVSGAVIVGLGEVGGLTPSRLLTAFRQAVLEFGLALCDLPEIGAGRGIEATLAAPLIGSGDKGVAIEDSLRAMLEATLSANQNLADHGLRCPVRIFKLQFVELYLDFAVEAGQILQSLLNRGRSGLGFSFEGGVRPLAGGLWRVLPARSRSWWQRLEIFGEAGGRLVYQPNPAGAGGRQERSHPQERLIEDIKAALISLGSGPDRLRQQAVLASTLRHLLLPSGFKQHGPHRSNLLLVLNREAARIPWELVYYDQPAFAEFLPLPDDAGSAAPAPRPLALVTGLVRQMVSATRRERVITAGGRSVLVIGDPAGPASELRGAQDEAQEVSALLEQQGLLTTCLVRASSTEIVGALLSHPYRVVHLAGHGVVDYPMSAPPPGSAAGPCEPSAQSAGQKVTGMLLDNGAFLTANELEALGRVPELVFVNCCHLGDMGAGMAPHGAVQSAVESIEFSGLLAASFALHLIEVGVRAVVAAAWKVSDGAARTFAITFYEGLMAGKPFGVAVLEARQRTDQKHPNTNTWAAYQAYGDPDYRFRLPEQVGQLPPIPERFVEPEEAIAELNNLVSLSATTSEKGIVELSARLDELKARIPDGWDRKPAVRVAVGEACRELDRIDEAIEHYTAALALNKSTLSLRELEQRCNLLSHQAIRRWRDPLDRAFTALSASECLDQCEQLLLDLPRADGTRRTDEELMSAERLALLASIYKRRCLLAPGSRRRKLIERSTELYRRAYGLHLTAADSLDLYPYLNYLSGCVALALRGDQPLEDSFQEQLDRARSTLAERLGQPSFWNLVDQVQIEWLGYLETGELPRHLDKVSRSLSEHWIRAGTLRQARAVFEHLLWMHTALEPARKAAAKGASEERNRAFVALRELCHRFQLVVGKELGDPKWSGFDAARPGASAG
jgi:tetratricopeptide (TPR) repeat protein